MNEKIGMDIRSFAELASRAVSERLGGRGQVKLQEVLKNNGIILQGLVILAEGKNISPTIYLNTFLEAYEAGVALSCIVDRILQIYEEDVPTQSIDIDFFREFDRVRDGICYRLVNRAKNKALLDRIPHVDFLDLSICFFYAYRDSALGAGSILIYNNHADLWSCGTETLMRLAQENTPRIFPWEIHGIGEMIEAAVQDGDAPALEGNGGDWEVPLQVLCNAQRVHGAACLIYPDVLGTLAERAQENLYIMPSSIHEVLILAESQADDPAYLRAMVRQVNRAHVEPEEILSDSLYFYHRLERHIEMHDA
ncbi:MAG: DUF5688 family protein [Muribaculum sp.]|nr:DUF5688 family protein [Muribaculum sp.]